MKRLFIFATVFVSLTIAFLVVFTQNKQEPSAVLSIESMHNIVADEERIMTIPLYFDGNDHDFRIKETIASARIRNLDAQKQIALNIIDVYRHSKQYYNDKEYYCYVYKMQLPIIDNEISIHQAYLELVGDNKDLLFPIGKFSYQPAMEHNSDFDIDVEKLHGIITDGTETLQAIVIKLKNNMEENIIIKNISLINNFISVNNAYITEIALETNTTSLTKLSEISDYDEPLVSEYVDCDKAIMLNVNNSKQFVLPLVYSSLCYFNHTPMLIEYTVNGIEKEYYVFDFLFFDNNFQLSKCKGVIAHVGY